MATGAAYTVLGDEVSALDAGALFSPCRRWRYMLWRRWDERRGVCAFVCLNPSTADETKDDPTVRRCVNYAKSWGYGALWMLNAYAFRATHPQEMKMQGVGAIGVRNDEYLHAAAVNSNLVVAAWGSHIDSFREQAILRMFRRAKRPMHVLGLTLQGHPKHPLYLRADLRPMPWLSNGA